MPSQPPTQPFTNGNLGDSFNDDSAGGSILVDDQTTDQSPGYIFYAEDELQSESTESERELRDLLPIDELVEVPSEAPQFSDVIRERYERIHAELHFLADHRTSVLKKRHSRDEIAERILDLSFELLEEDSLNYHFSAVIEDAENTNRDSSRRIQNLIMYHLEVFDIRDTSVFTQSFHPSISRLWDLYILRVRDPYWPRADLKNVIKRSTLTHLRQTEQLNLPPFIKFNGYDSNWEEPNFFLQVFSDDSHWFLFDGGKDGRYFYEP
jgi:hypothetical protein